MECRLLFAQVTFQSLSICHEEPKSCCECTDTKPSEQVRRRLRVNIKSLAAESRIIRAERKKATTADVAASLRNHHVLRVRPEARAAQLLYAFVRGVPYRVVERTTKLSESDRKCLIDSVANKAKRHWIDVRNFTQWMEAA